MPMDAAKLDIPLRVVSAADGFLAGLIYLDATRKTGIQDRATGPFFPAQLLSWEFLEDIWVKLERARSRILELMPILGSHGLDDTLDTFFEPVMFFEAAVLSLQSTLVGRTPRTLGGVLALHCLAHVVSSRLRSHGDPSISESLPCNDYWGSMILTPDHRQAFTDLAKALCLEPANPPIAAFGALHPVTPLQEYGCQLDFPFEDAPFELQPAQDNFLSSCLVEFDDATPDLLAPPHHPSLSRETKWDASDRVQPPTNARPQVSELQRSAIVTNLTCFLEQCGELFHILSGRGVATKHQNLPSSIARYKANSALKSDVQFMRQNFSFQDPSCSAITSIVDTFIELGYLTTAEDVQEYMLIVGKEIMPDKAFVKYCPMVVNNLGIAPPSGSRSPSKQPTAGAELKKFPCSVCRKRFTRRSNMHRHRNSVHRHMMSMAQGLTERSNRVYSVIPGKQLRTQFP